jgi:hypothetical protein
MNSVTSLVGYGLAFLAALIIAARWIYLNHPALRDGDRAPPGKSAADRPADPGPDVLKAATRPLPRD